MLLITWYVVDHMTYVVDHMIYVADHITYVVDHMMIMHDVDCNISRQPCACQGSVFYFKVRFMFYT